MKAGDISKANLVKIFSATMMEQRAQIGDRVTAWIAEAKKRGCEILDIDVTQSSDSAFHCLTYTIWTHDPNARGARR